MDADGHPFGKETAVPNHQIQRLPASLMNSLQSIEDVELYQIHNMEETDLQHDLNYDHIVWTVQISRIPMVIPTVT